MSLGSSAISARVEGTSLKVGEKQGREGSCNGVIARAGEGVGREERGLSSHYRGVVDRGGVVRGQRNQEVLHVSLQLGVLTPNSFFNVT